jgi:hypothetical protein
MGVKCQLEDCLLVCLRMTNWQKEIQKFRIQDEFSQRNVLMSLARINKNNVSSVQTETILS